jgi:hypothetical protein
LYPASIEYHKRKNTTTTMHGISKNGMAAHLGVLFYELSCEIFSLYKQTSKYTKNKISEVLIYLEEFHKDEHK